MDPCRFDDFARLTAHSSSRRRLLGALAAGFAALVGHGSLSAASCRPPSGVCRKHGDCCSGICGATDATGRRRCVCPQGSEPCGGGCVETISYDTDPLNCGACGNVCPRTACSAAVCNAGVCELVADTEVLGASCSNGNSCVTGETCQPDGSCGDGTIAGDGSLCGSGGRCVNATCVLAYPNCGGACSANTPSIANSIGNMCFGVSSHCVQPVCGGHADCPAGFFCGVTNSCGNGFENRCFEGCPA